MMWPPTNVVQEHKRRAIFIWVSLVSLIIGYTLWLIITTYEKRNNPTVSISIEDDRYTYPTITICAFAGTWVGYGCDSPDYSCSQTMHTYIFNPVGFENINGDTYTSDASVINEEVSPEIYLQEAYPYECVDIDQSDMTETENDSAHYPLRLTFWAEWSLNDGTDGADNGLENSEGAYVYFTDPEVPNPLGSHELSTFVGVIPYTRQLATETPDSFTQTSITMKLTESINLDETNVKTYSAATISSKDYLIPDRTVVSETLDAAILFMEILQPELTHTIRKEVDPLEWTELMGSIGGTWEILLVIWGIFFIAIKSGEPELKGRNLVKTVKTGAQNAVRGAASIASRVSTKRGSGESPPSEGEETLPTWDMPPSTTSDGTSGQALRPPPAYDSSASGSMQSSSGGQHQASGDTHRGRPSVDGLICVPSRDIPAIVDLPRPAPKPF